MNAVSPDLDRRFRDAAAREGLLDVAYDLVDSPIGSLLVATSPRGLCRISYDADSEREVEQLARAFGLRVLRSPKPIDAARRELDEYFEGKRHSFDLAVDVALLADFNRRVLRELARVPYGEVVTYGELATRAALHHDAHLVKYTLACFDAATADPGRRRLYLSAAASLSAWWAQQPGSY